MQNEEVKKTWKTSAGKPEDIDAWMALICAVRQGFPGLETQELLDAHRATVLRFMAEGRALCVKENGQIVGVLLLSRKHNMICCLAVAPECRRRGVAAALMERAILLLDGSREITVATFREEDPKGTASRALYARFGFEPEALGMENGYPVQRFVRKAGKGARV